MTTNFDDIRPFNTDEIPAATQRMADSEVIPAIADFLGVSADALRERIRNIHTIREFQWGLLKEVIEILVAKTTTGFDWSGLENISEKKPYLFVSNHRDIVLDAMFLQYILYADQQNTCQITFGSNLMSHPFVIDFGKVNKMFRTERGGTPKEFYNSMLHMSEYMRHVITEVHESVWIAQRNGRTKDGLDKTQQGLIKMLTFYDESRDVIEILKEMHITPLTVSYEYEPCDKLKARELALSENEKYVKKPGEDFNSVKQGIFGWKGEVNFVIGKPIDEQLDTISPELRKNDKLNEVAKIIDQQIYQNYHLFATNYIAYDYLSNCQEFAEYYTSEQREKFLQYIDKQSIVEDVDADKMKSYLLQIYANPVKTHYGKELNHKEDNDW